MNWIDGHLDLAYLAVTGRDLTMPMSGEGGCVTLPALRDGGFNLVLATIFTEPNEADADKPWAYAGSDDVDGAERAGLKQLELYEQLESHGEVSIVRTRRDLQAQTPLPKIVILMEGADPIRSPAHLTEWVRRGVRAVGLAWAEGTRYAGGNGKPGPLTNEGRELVAALDEHGVIHDTSHLPDESFDDLFECAGGPIVASHSNCRALVAPKQRHLTDAQITRIAERGGMIGINLFSRFLVPQGRATIDDVTRHIQHIEGLTGQRDCLGLGSDMDGGFMPDELPQGLDLPARFDALADALRTRGWSEDEVNGFTHQNWLARLEQWLPA